MKAGAAAGEGGVQVQSTPPSSGRRPRAWGWRRNGWWTLGGLPADARFATGCPVGRRALRPAPDPCRHPPRVGLAPWRRRAPAWIPTASPPRG